ncbi:MAG TPA: hypothetical protein VHN14_10385 [Kofleriaceae bacterium]|nr:hypothetical protein [Kofleriaceae bacterium]
MDLTLISHASVIVDCGHVVVWTDPWLESRAFNNSWELLPAPSPDRTFLERVTHIWVSHEHPDHFNIPTLRSLPAEFRERVTVCYQKRNTTKIFDALRKLGYRRFFHLRDRAMVRVEDVTLYCFQAHLGDSVLGIRHGDRRLLNINDAEIDERDCKRILAEFGRPDVVLNQFSIAGYVRSRDLDRDLPRLARDKLDQLVRNHQWLEANLTVPFASFMHFCMEDNAYLNRYANHPRDVVANMTEHGCRCYVMGFGETIEVVPRKLPDMEANFARYEKELAAAATRSEPSPRVEVGKIRQAYEKFFANLDANIPLVIRRWWLDRIAFHVPDLELAIRVGAAEHCFELLRPDPEGADVVVNSQPLWFGFAFPYGFETLGTSGRSTVNHFRPWQAWKRASILLNLEISLKPALLLQPSNRRFLRERLTNGLVRQFASKQARIKRARLDLT